MSEALGRRGARASLLAVAAFAVAAVLPSTAAAAVSCTFLSGAQQVNVDLNAHGDQAVISQEAIADGGEIRVDPIVPNDPEVSCLEDDTAADHTNTDEIIVSEPADLDTTVIIDMAGGGFANTLEVDVPSEIEISLPYATGGDDTLRLNGTASDDHWTLGADGINFNTGLAGDADMDIVFIGGPTPDTTLETKDLQPGAGNDTVDARGGADTGGQLTRGVTFWGDLGNDTVHGGSGDDRLHGQDGDDTLVGRGGSDTYGGEPGDDVLDGVTDSDLVPDTLNFGLAGGPIRVDMGILGTPQDAGAADTEIITGDFNLIYGSPFDDLMQGSPNGEQMRGQAGDDVVDGDAGNDQLYGVFGSDLVRGGPGNDSLFGSASAAEAGVDTVLYDTAPTGVTVDFAVGADGGAGSDGIAFFENIVGSPFADTITGDDGPNVLTGGDGPDQVFGLGGGDTLKLRDGVADTGDCGDGSDLAEADDLGTDTLIGCETLAGAPIPTEPGDPPDARCPTLRKQLKTLKKARKKARTQAKRKKKGKQIRRVKKKLRKLGC